MEPPGWRRLQAITGPGGRSPSSNLPGLLLVLLSACAFAAQSIAIKLAYSAGVNVPTLAMIRGASSTLVLAMVAGVVGRARRLERSTAASLVLLGALAGLGGLLILESLARIPAGLAILVLYTYPAIVVVLALLLGQERMDRPKLIGLLLALGGVALIAGAPAGHVDGIGMAAAAGASVATALFAVLMGHVGHGIHPLTSSIYVMSGGMMTFTAAGALSGDLQFALAPEAWFWALIVGVVLYNLAVVSYVAAIGRVGPSRTAISTTLDPALTVVLGAVVLGEILRATDVVGGVLILIAATVLPLTRALPVERPPIDHPLGP